jgi:hypothetical protein
LQQEQAMQRLVSVLVLAALLSPCAHADCVAAAATRPHLVELYTSEGCSSCPPADTWLRGLPPSAAALEFHVDYWDSLGWRDRFAAARYTTRQRQQATRDGGDSVYTPQVVLDGRSWRDWYRGREMPALPAAAALRVQITPGAPLHVRVDTTLATAANGPAFRNYVAITEDGLASQVRAGENRGALLRHDHVVRAFAGPLPLAGGEADIDLPPDLDPARARLVAFAQDADNGHIAQVASCKLP